MSRITFLGFRDAVDFGAGPELYWSEAKHGKHSGIACRISDDGMWFEFLKDGIDFIPDVPVTNITYRRRAKEAARIPPPHPWPEGVPVPRPIADEPPTGPMKKQNQETKK